MHAMPCAGTAATASNTRLEAVPTGTFATPLSGSSSGEAMSLRQEDNPTQVQAKPGTSEQTTTGASTMAGAFSEPASSG